MFKILVIESFTNRPERKKFWEEVMEALKDTSLSFDIREIASLPESHKDYNLIFVHESDDHGITAELEERNKPFVRYGGRTDQVEAERISKLVIDFLPISVLKANLTTFVKKLILDGAVSVDNLQTLIGFNPLLEAKLELLHACLTPEGLKTVIWGKDGEITITREGQEPFKGRIPDNRGKTEFEQLKEITDGPFGEQYIQALTRLRDALLPEHE